MEIKAQELVDFLLILLRAGIVMTLLPVFGSKNLRATFRIGLALSLSFLLTPLIDIKVSEGDIQLMIISEVLIGLIMGIIARSVFIVAEMAGQVISNSIGLSMATVFDPEAGYFTEVSRLFWIISLFRCYLYLCEKLRDCASWKLFLWRYLEGAYSLWWFSY